MRDFGMSKKLLYIITFKKVNGETEEHSITVPELDKGQLVPKAYEYARSENKSRKPREQIISVIEYNLKEESN